MHDLAFTLYILDNASAALLSRLADSCADEWRTKDSGMWELGELKHYTMSKISCWQALAGTVELADQGQLPTACRERWARERDRIAAWIEANCWSEAKQAFTMYPGTEKLDAALALAVRFRFDEKEKLALTLDAIDSELGSGAFYYRYSGMDEEEECFIACTFWMIEARALMGQLDQAEEALKAVRAVLDSNLGILAEMIDPRTSRMIGNLPQGLSHLAHVMTL